MSEPLLESVKILRLRRGDVIVVEARPDINSFDADDLRTQVRRRFPGHEVVVTSGLHLTIAREEKT